MPVTCADPLNADMQPCAACGNPLADTARFCSSCGAPVAKRQKSTLQNSGEHRQLTVMFCDLIGSTALSNRLDAEDLRDVLRRYQQICADAIEARDGIIGQYLGDGVLAYFGYPKASESAAVHAADAALDIVRDVKAAGDVLLREHGVEFATRVALHTGRVLIGEMGAGQTRDRHALTGAVPNLAARLEQVAPRNGVAISGQTAALVSGAFETETMGHHAMKGFGDPVEAFRVMRRKWSLPVIPTRESALIGREAEMRKLSDIWSDITETGRRTVTVVAEPGMGKSALAAAFMSSNGITQDRIIEVGGTLRNRNTPFACLRETIGRWTALGKIRDALPTHKQIAHWFGVSDVELSPHAQTFAHLLDGEIEEGREGRARVFAACRARIARFPKPMLIVVEDAHWVDPSTAEILDGIIGETDGVMLLKLTRPDAEITPGSETLALKKLDADACRALIETTAGGAVDAGLSRMITDVSGGLPLFVEEFTKSLQDSGSLSLVRGVYRPLTLNTKVETPASILDLITVRLDALGEAKSLAQVCAVLGRSFTQAALGAVSGEPQDRLEALSTRLIEAKILTREWSGQLAFRHALFQTAAYESLVKAERQRLHGRFLDWLQRKPNLMEATPPETLGYHLKACGRPREAAECYMKAGKLADRASASLEAATHFGKCCDLLADAGEDAGTLPLQAQVMLAGALLSARGAGAAETRRAYEIATALAEGLPESEWHFAAYWGWWRVSDTFATMAQRAGHLLEKSRAMKGLEFKLQAQHCVWANAFQMGELDTSIRSAQDGLELYEKGGFGDNRTYYGGHDCKVCALGEIALASWLKGAGDAATVSVQQAIAHAEHLDHLGTLLHALDIAVMLHHYRRDAAAVSHVAGRLIKLATAHDLEDYRAKGEIFAGWVDIEAGNLRNGLARVDAGFATMHDIGTPEDFPVYQCIRADALGRLGDPDGAQAALDGGHAVIAAEGVNYWGAEIARQEAEIEMMRPVPDTDRISERLAEASRLARSQGALALELRACLTRLEWARRGHIPVSDALEALRVVRRRFAKDATGRTLSEADDALSLSSVR